MLSFALIFAFILEDNGLIKLVGMFGNKVINGGFSARFFIFFHMTLLRKNKIKNFFCAKLLRTN